MDSRISALCVILLFVILAGAVIHGVSRELWFDESFSIQTAHKLNNGEQIIWQEYDVHPPLYYETLVQWMAWKPGFLTETEWARWLSVLFGCLFLYGLFVFTRKLLSEQQAVVFIGAFVLLSTVVHYATEARQYMMVMAFAVWSAYCIVSAAKDVTTKKAAYQVIIAALLAGCATLAHYYAALIYPMLFFLLLLLGWNQSRKHHMALLGMLVLLGTAAVTAIFFKIALPQMQRGEGMWFNLSSLASYPSALIFAFVQPISSSNPLAIAAQVLFYVFILLFVYMMWWVWRHIKTGNTRAEKVAIVGVGMALLPFLALVVTPLLGSGFGNLYHHRFFLGVMWLFVWAAWYMLLKGEWRTFFIMGVLTVMLVAYAGEAHHELENTIAAMPCGATIVHESPFSGLPAVVGDRERDCWRNTHIISTLLEGNETATAGFDAWEEEDVYFNFTLPCGELYYFRTPTGRVKPDQEPGRRIWNGSFDVVHKEEGLWLVAFNNTRSSCINNSRNEQNSYIYI